MRSKASTESAHPNPRKREREVVFRSLYGFEMKYFLGKILVEEETTRREHERIFLVAANHADAAMKHLAEFAAQWDDPGEEIPVISGHAAYRYSEDQDPYTVSPVSIEEISAAAFFGIKGLHRIGSPVNADLLAQEAPEQTKTLARRLVAQFERLGLQPIPYGKVLTALAACLGETDWQVLRHRALRPVLAIPAPGTPERVELRLGIATHHHKHGEDHFLFQEVPTKEEAIAAIDSESGYEPSEEEYIDTGHISVDVDVAWLMNQVVAQRARTRAEQTQKHPGDRQPRRPHRRP